VATRHCQRDTFTDAHAPDPVAVAPIAIGSAGFAPQTNGVSRVALNYGSPICKSLSEIKPPQNQST